MTEQQVDRMEENLNNAYQLSYWFVKNDSQQTWRGWSNWDFLKKCLPQSRYNV